MSTLKHFSKAIWDELALAFPNYDDTAKQLTILITELRHRKIEAKPHHARNITGHRTRHPVDKIISNVIGKSLGSAGNVCVPILGVSLKLSQVFALADQSDHLLHDACKQFLTEHSIALKPLRTNRSVTYMISRV